jgi:hypothetical protein
LNQDDINFDIFKFQNLEFSNNCTLESNISHNSTNTGISIMEADCEDKILMFKTTKDMMDINKLFASLSAQITS